MLYEVITVTNIDADHLDYYRDLDQIKETFIDFINKVPFFGLAVLCLDDPVITSYSIHYTKLYERR